MHAKKMVLALVVGLFGLFASAASVEAKPRQDPPSFWTLQIEAGLDGMGPGGLPGRDGCDGRFEPSPIMGRPILRVWVTPPGDPGTILARGVLEGTAGRVVLSVPPPYQVTVRFENPGMVNCPNNRPVQVLTGADFNPTTRTAIRRYGMWSALPGYP